MNINYSNYYDCDKFSDIEIITIDNISKHLHKIVLSNNSDFFKECINKGRYTNKINLNFKWKHLDPVLKFIYTNDYNYNYPHIENIKDIIDDFIEIIHISSHLKLNNTIINTIIEHFNYKKRLENINLDHICYLLYSLFHVLSCKKSLPNNEIIINLCNRIILKTLLSLDTFYDSISLDDNKDEIFSLQIYNNIICVWNLDQISSITIQEFIDKNLNLLQNKNILLNKLYLITKKNNFTYPELNTHNCYNQIDIPDISICNNIIRDSITSNILFKPSSDNFSMFKILCSDNNECIINKLLNQNKNINLLEDKVSNNEKKLYCSICYTEEKNKCIKSCGHGFCSLCLDEMKKQRNPKCPECKQEYYQYDIIDLYL